MKRVIFRFTMDLLAASLAGGFIGVAHGFWPGLLAILLVLSYSLWCYMDGWTSA